MRLQNHLARGLVFVLFACGLLIQQWSGVVQGKSSISVDEALVSTSIFRHPPRPSSGHHGHQLLFNGEYHDVKILTNSHGYTIANGLSEYFKYVDVSASIVETIDGGDVSRNILYIALFAFQYDFPPGLKYIAYQLEQKQQSAWFNDKYRKNLAESAYVFDYSVQNYQNMEIGLQKKTIYLPVPLTLKAAANISSEEDKKEKFEFDVLFFGAPCVRRSRILDELQNKYNLRIKVVNYVFGESLAEIIKKACIVLNLHFYESALLETVRINEVLQYDKIIVSEDPMTEDKYSRTLYKDAVIFTKNLDEYNGDDDRHIEELATTLRFYSDPANYPKYIAERRTALASLKEHCFGRFVKALISIQAFSPTSFYERLHSPDDTATIHYLSQDETWQTRRETFHRQPHLPANIKFKRIAAIKAWPELLGSGMSYKFAINSAKMSGLDQITICEDDALFPPTFERNYQIIREYLSTLDKWDIFVGLISDFDNSTKIINVENYEGLEFVTIDKFTSTVLNIYNASSYDHILAWGDATARISIMNSTSGEKTRNDYDNRPMTIITMNPSVLMHMDIGSTTWRSERNYPEWFATPADVFAKGVEEFKSTIAVRPVLHCKGSCRRKRQRTYARAYSTRHT